ncbi:MAG: AAA family ATPase [Thermoleophilia bacterium]|nr:AAA family ATPase [Thermoleophilia bacterium]
MAEPETEPQDTIRLEDYLRIAWNRAWIIILAVVVVVATALVVSLRTTPLYSASAELVYEKTSMDTAVFGYEVLGYDYDRPRTIETAIAAINRSESIAEGVKAQLTSTKETGELSGMVSATANADTDLVSVSAVSTDPVEAAAVANAFADQFIVYRQKVARALVADARDLIKNQLDTLSGEQTDTAYKLMLQDKYESLRILEAMQDGDFKLIRRAVEPAVPFTPQTKRNLILALVVGLVLGAGLAFLIEYLDKRIKDEKTLERISGLPVLASVPAVGGRWRRAKSGRRSSTAVGFEGPSSVLLEPFRTLRSSLQYFDVDSNLRTLMVTSALAQEGKTVTTVNLAISLALSGKRVIVLEADLRRPMVHEYLNLENKIGLSSVLAGQSSVSSALQLVLMDAFIPPKARKDQGGESDRLVLRKNLYCMTSGPLPPNPAELLGSVRMRHVISELKHMADYLLIDTPPVLPVSDALTLASHADAVILTARLYSTTREEMEEVRSLLNRAGVRAIGVVAGGVKPRGNYYYKRGYQYGYGS